MGTILCPDDGVGLMVIRRVNQDRRANYEIVNATSDFLTIRDLGPWDQYMTVTNAAEEVLQELIEKNILHEGQRLLYYDSENNLDEIEWKNGRFVGFKAYRK